MIKRKTTCREQNNAKKLVKNHLKFTNQWAEKLPSTSAESKRIPRMWTQEMEVICRCPPHTMNRKQKKKKASWFLEHDQRAQNCMLK